jgi:hypothetical protein
MSIPFSSLLVCTLALASTAHSQDNTVEAGSARYRVTFAASWSASTHPNAYPSSAHFSPLIGATHATQTSLWGPGALATPGIEQMAETGATSLLIGEVNDLISQGAAGQVVSGGGVGTSPGMALGIFDIDTEHPLVSLVTMVAPSPDWFVGVHDLELLEGGQWVEVLEVPLLAYDAGTDSGLDFFSPNADTQPAEPISLISGGPFTGATPLGTFRFERMWGSVVYGPNPADSLVQQVGVPALGANLTLGLNDPTGSFPDGSLALLAVSGQSQVPFFDGLSLPGFGLQPGTEGALLVQSPFDYLSAPNLVASSTSLTVPIPNSDVIGGATFYVQGVFIDPVTLRAGLTQAAQLLLND